MTRAYISSTVAVQLTRAVDPAVAAEMEPGTAGGVTAEDAIDTVRRRLAWARTSLRAMSPFTTPFGPSTLWFYVGNGTIVDMTAGFDAIAGESRQDQLLRLAGHVRTFRGRLMVRYYGTSSTGSFIERTTTFPLHRGLSDALSATCMSEDIISTNATASFIQRAVQRIVGRSGVSAGNVHSENIERQAALLLPRLDHHISTS